MIITKIESPYVYTDHKDIRYTEDMFINKPEVGNEVALCAKGKLFALKDKNKTE